ncbi:extracellular solute-binding protein [Paenibacillus azoreducens]|uniref:ABC transporter peptide-binding protein YtcQ n=1 Tax=Paenibacillus azoreducens TaxID=116718 RepID=A0A920CTM3_9BACL|nr:extracellular solute-binding protein [Paenibacillus azoreducens]GIO48537.1 putative ABC transporter peptide-binding protein YtcQ [Paenibacillus azoreducens]
MIQTKKSMLMKSMLVVLGASVLLTACGGGSKGAASDSSEPTKIQMQTLNYATEFIDNTNVIWKEFEKRTNTKLDITWLSPSTSDEKINVMLASGDLPEVTFVETLLNPQLQKMIEQGVFWDLTPYLKDYPNLTAPNLAEMWSVSKVNGKNYVIPRYYPSYGGGAFPILRKDWMDKLGLQTPTTMDQLFDVLKAFKEKDPNGNGQADEIPYAANPDTMGFVYGVFNGTQGQWKLKDDKLVPVITQDESRDAVLWIKKAYDAGLFPKDFAIMKYSQTVDLIRGGSAGGTSQSMNHAWVTGEKIREVVPTADYMPITYLENAQGEKYTPSGAPYYGVYLIPKKVPEAKVKKILEFFDYAYGKEGNELATYGLEGVHYKVENGRKIPTPQSEKDHLGDGNMNNLIHLISDDMAIGAVGMPDDVYNRNVDIVNERKKIKTPEPGRELYSEAYNKYYPEIQKKVSDMRTKVIIGKDTIENYDKLIEQLRNDPNLQKVADEMTEAYHKKMSSK